MGSRESGAEEQKETERKRSTGEITAGDSVQKAVLTGPVYRAFLKGDVDWMRRASEGNEFFCVKKSNIV